MLIFSITALVLSSNGTTAWIDYNWLIILAFITFVFIKIHWNFYSKNQVDLFKRKVRKIYFITYCCCFVFNDGI